ncbi:MAG: sulfurtransferase [candidate division Zixibacteria bacterium]|nr:sulfurtransferase [candidate division Zixibacteria bacterium]
MKRIKFPGWLFSLGLLGVLATVFALPVSSQMPPGKLVSTEWLEQNLPNENLRIIDVRQSIKDYWQSHIPGAVYLNPEALRLADRGVPGKLMPPEALVVMLGKMGVSKKTTVVICSEQNDFKATYLLWALDYLGHASAVMLGGGFDKWGKEERPVTQDYPEIKPVEYGLPAELNQEVRATLQEVKEVVSQGGALLIDVRPAQLYTGEKGFWKRKGHIKGAINHFWGDDLNEDGSWKSREELKQAYEKLGATPDRTVIVSCGQGLMSSHTYFSLKYVLGYPNVKNYDGSFNEWSNIEDLPVEIGTGENR